MVTSVRVCCVDEITEPVCGGSESAPFVGDEQMISVKSYEVGDPVILNIGGKWRRCRVSEIAGDVYWITVYYTIRLFRDGEITELQPVMGIRPFKLENSVLKFLNQYSY